MSVNNKGLIEYFIRTARRNIDYAGKTLLWYVKEDLLEDAEDALAAAERTIKEIQ